MNRWPKIALGQVLQRSDEFAVLDPEAEYHELTIKLWGKGIVSRGKVRGSDVSTARRLVRGDQLVLSKIDARHGAIGVVPSELDGAIVSNDFPSFCVDRQKVEPGFLGWFVRSAPFVALCKASSEGTTNRVRIKEGRFLSQIVALPPLAEQRRIVARLDTLADKVRQVAEKLDAIEADSERLLAARFRETIAGAPRLAMGRVAPVIRRNVDVQIDRCYREVGARSFGKGLFPKPDFDGAEATWHKPVWIERGDLVVSNIKAWEGAFAVAEESHHGCIASHRYLTCVPNPEIATPHFLRYYLLSSEGLEQIGLASPGTADRNRTLSQSSLGEIVVPVPRIETQRSFDSLQSRVASLKSHHAAIREANSALLPAMLERLFHQYA